MMVMIVVFNISVISVITGVPRENQQLVASHWQTLSRNVSIGYTSPERDFKLTTNRTEYSTILDL